MKPAVRKPRTRSIWLAVLPLGAGILLYFYPQILWTAEVEQAAVLTVNRDPLTTGGSDNRAVAESMSTEVLPLSKEEDKLAGPSKSKDVTDGGADPEWLAVPRASRSLARLFALAPLGVKTNHLIRHKDLNLPDSQLGQHKVDRLQSLLANHQECIRTALKSYGQARHALMKTLDARGQLTELSTAMLDSDDRREMESAARRGLISRGVSGDEALRAETNKMLLDSAKEIVPDVAAFLMKEGRVLVASKNQLDRLELSREYEQYLRAAFLYEVIAWFIAEGLTNDAAVKHVVDEFEVLN